MLQSIIKNIYRVVFFIGMPLCTYSCSDFFDVEVHHAAGESQQWETLEDTRAGLMGIYGLMRAALADNGTQWICGDLRGGDFTVVKRKDLQDVVDNDLNSASSLVADIADWRRFYAVINAASVFMENAPAVPEKDQAYSDEFLSYDIAQARTLRALAYFYMARIWGDVPLITYAYDNGTFSELPRTSVDKVLAYAKNELLSAVDDLPFDFGTNENNYYRQSPESWRGVLLNKLSAYAILAHVSAWMGNYADAEAYSNFVLENAGRIEMTYLPVENIVSATGLFCSDNADKKNRSCRLAAFSFLDSNQETSRTGHIEELTLASPYIRKTEPDIFVSLDTLHAIYTDLADQRFGMDTLSMSYTNTFFDISQKYPIFKKINVVQNGAAADNDYAVFGSIILFSRFEDMVLLHAEALAALNRPSEALEELNALREERGLERLSYQRNFSGDRMKLLDGIFEERRRELIGEGWRWYDRIRRQKLIHDDSHLEELMQNGGIYWPVAESVIVANPNIVQNSYWRN